MKKTAFFIAALLLLFFLASCSGNQNNEITKFNPYKGSQGITVEFLKNSPPKNVFHNESFNIALKLQNKGAFHVIENKTSKNAVFFNLEFDRYYFESLTNPSGKISLNGKSYEDRQGQAETIDFLLRAKELQGQIASPESQIIFNICYPYETKLVQDVCIDSDPFDLDARKKSCQATTIALTDQGAPIAIKQIEPRMNIKTHETNTYVSPSFTITLKNAGAGNFAAKTDKPLIEQCSIKDTGFSNFGKAKINARLSNYELVCTPEYVNFVNNEGTSNCRIANNDFIPLTFVSQPDTLHIDIEYIYLEAHIRKIEILR